MVLSQHPGNYNNTMIWAACCLAYFRLLRVSKFPTPSPDHFDSTTDLLLSDIALDSRESSTTVQITLRMNSSGRGIQYIWVKLPMLSAQ